MTIEREQAAALLECVQVLMDAVPESGKPEVAGWYDTIASALWHPEN
jgi:hypothetical protein